MDYSELLSPLKLSLLISITSLVLVTIIGIILAGLIGKNCFKGKVLFETILMLPLVLPPTVIGFFLVVFLGGNSTIGKLFESIFHKSLMFTWWAAVIAASIVA
ncbi:MAG TPA: molybdate ABC transporter permease subunit, partial [Pseudoneobacillus sp.]|nr:molybdate ABC transporter permease subunit [Pseudoneobacillus sp.]